MTGGNSKLAANYFTITIGDINVIYQYDLQIKRCSSPGNTAPINGSQKARIVWLLMNQLRGENNKIAMATNFKTMIITSAKLGGRDVPIEMEIEYYDEYQQTPPDPSSVFQVHIEAPQRLILSDLVSDLSSDRPRNPDYKHRDQTLAALNVIFSSGPHKKCFVQQPLSAARGSEVLPAYTTIDGGKFYGVANRNGNDTATGPPLTDGKGRPRRDDGVKSILGFTRSVRPFAAAQGKLNLNINTTTAMFYPSTGTVADLIRLWTAPNWESDPILSHYLDLFLTNLRVRTNYGGGQVSDYITSIAGIPGGGYGEPKPTAATWRMVLSTSQRPSVKEYFESQRYGPVQSDGYVVYIGNRNNPIPFPAERLYIIPGQMVRNSSEKPAGAIRGPGVNRELILKRGVSLFSGNSLEDGPAAFHLRLGTEMLQVPVTHLKTPQIQYQRGNVMVSKLSNGAWDLSKEALHTASKKPTKFTYLVIETAGQITCTYDSLQTFVTNFENALKKYGMQKFEKKSSSNPSDHRLQLLFKRLPGTPQVKELATQRKAIEVKLLALFALGIRLVMIVLPKKDQDLYCAIKQVGDVQVGLSTICTVAVKQATKTSPDFFANLCLKVNLKTDRGTVNQSLKVKEPILTKRTMIMGIDVTHPGPNAMAGAPSIAAVVGSIDSEFAQWPASFGAVYPNPDKESKEEIDNLGDLVYKRIKDYTQHNNGVQPEKLIIYRDGLSEGQFEMCKTVEYASIQQGLDRFARETKSPKPKVLLICAVKRHHTRLFPNPGQKDDRLLDRNGNPRPGTMVSDGITYGNGQDFFLISHQAIMGTARPTHYIVLRNDLAEKNNNGMNLQAIAQMTHNLCYLFGRATRSVSICPPAYYADLAADRARVWVRRYYNAPKVDGKRKSYDRATMDDWFVGKLLAEHQNLRGQMFYI